MINHLLLTLEHASCKGLSVLGYVLNEIEEQPSLAAQTSREALASLTGVPCLGELPYARGSEAGNIPPADWFGGLLELDLLGSVLNHGKKVFGFPSSGE
jgi:hypothetical protein